MTTLKRSGTATWERGLSDGQGWLTTDSRTLDAARFSFPIRFGAEKGTNPEELIAAAHAGCFSMALAYLLGNAGMPPELIEVTADLSLEIDASGPRVNGIHLRARAKVPGAVDAEFQRIAAQAKETCLVSRMLRVPVSLEAVLVGG